MTRAWWLALALGACGSETEDRLADRTWVVTHLRSDVTQFAGLQPLGTIEVDDPGTITLGPDGAGAVDLVIESRIGDPLALAFVPWSCRIEYDASDDAVLEVQYVGGPPPEQITWHDDGTWTSELDLGSLRVARTYTVVEAP